LALKQPSLAAHPWLTAGAGAALATVLFFWRVVFTPAVFVARDAVRGVFPLERFFASEVSAGRFPEWYPYDGLGQSFPGTVVAGAFHPLNALYLLFTTPTAYEVVCLLAFGAAAFGAFGLATRVGVDRTGAAIAAGAYAFCGPMICLTNNSEYLLSATTLPFVAWAAIAMADAPAPRRLATFGGALTLVLLAGDPMGFVVAAAAGAALVFIHGGWKRWPWVLAAWALSLALAAPQLLTALAAAREASAGARSLEEAQIWSGHPLRLLEWAFGPLWLNASREVLSPDSLGAGLEPRQGSLWYDSEHLGPGVLLLVALGAPRWSRAARWTAAGVAVLFLLWLGRNTPLYALVYELAPFWRPFRYPEKLLPFIFLALAVGAGWALGPTLEKPRRAVIVATVAAVACAAAGFLSRSLFESAGSLALLAAALHLRSRPLAATALLAPLVLWGPSLALSADPSLLETPPKFVNTLRARAGSGLFWVDSRVGSVDVSSAPAGTAGALLTEALQQALRPDVLAWYGLGSREAYFPAATRRSRSLAAQGRDDAFIARFAVTQQEDVRPGETRIDADEALGLALVERPALPPISLRPYRCVSSLEEAERAVAARKSIDEPSVAECEGEGVAAVQGSVGETISTPTGGLLVFSSAYADGWTAELDGQSAPVLPADVALRSVRVPPGDHRVQLRYRAPGLRIGAVIGAIGLLVLLALCLRRRAIPTAT
jgi:hypothetical protein